MDWRKHFDLADEAWRYDIMPEVMDGKNIADFVDADIEAKLLELEREEDEAMELAAMEANGIEEPDEQEAAEAENLRQTAAAIRKKKSSIVQEHRLNKGVNRPQLTKKGTARSNRLQQFEDHMADMGVETGDQTSLHRRTRSRSRTRVQEEGKASQADAEMETEGSQRRGRSKTRKEMATVEGRMLGGQNEAAQGAGKKRSRSVSKSRERSVSVAPGEGFNDVSQKIKAQKLANKSQKMRNRSGKAGESDRVIMNNKPKHLFSGKRGMGKTDRR